VEETIREIARKHFDIKTLEERKMDSLDFYSVAVWCVRNALIAAYEAGRKSNGSVH
jgi:hypothetical protein